MTAPDAPPVTQTGNPLPTEAHASGWRRIWRWLLQRFWYVHSGMTLTVTIPPNACFGVLKKLSKPDVRLLKFHQLYAGGRRYKLYVTRNDGFAVTTSSSVPWRYRRRTEASAVVYGDFEQVEELTQIHLRGTIRVTYILSSFLLPAFFGSMVIYMPWNLAVRIGLIVMLFGLSWAGHRLNAALEAYEIMNFVQKGLEEFAPAAPAAMPSGGGHVVYERQKDFAEAWDKFYDYIREDQQERPE